MAKQKIEIEVEVPDGWEAVDYRLAKKGEYYLDSDGANPCQKDFFHCPSVILRKKREWPAWCTAKYLAWDADGECYAFAEKPEIKPDDRFWISAHGYIAGPLSEIADLPLISDWKESLIENPNWKEPTK